MLYSRSRVNLFSSSNLVDNIKEVDDKMYLSTSAGVKVSNQKTGVPQYGEVWYDKEYITNVYFFKDMIKNIE